MEQAVVGNNYLKRLMSYREVLDIDDEGLQGQISNARRLHGNAPQMALSLPGSTDIRSASNFGSRSLAGGHGE